MGRKQTSSLDARIDWKADLRAVMPGAMGKKSHVLSRREVLGFALAPLPVVGPVILMFAVFLSTVPPDSVAALQAAAELVLLSYIAAVVLGLPIHLLLRWKRQTGLLAYLGLTVTAVTVASGLVLLLEGHFSDRANNPFAFAMWSWKGVMLTLLFAAVACLCAFIFWAVAVRHRRT